MEEANPRAAALAATDRPVTLHAHRSRHWEWEVR